MSSGKLKAQYNRVRTSTALQANSMWTSTIGLEQDQAGSNSAIEASLRAPTRGGGGGREARRQAAQDLIEAAGYQPAVTSFEGLVALARAKNIGGENRGACKICGGLGHLTKQCRNQPATTSAAAGGPAEAGGVPIMQLIPPDTAQESDSFSSLSDLSSSSDSDSDSDSDSSAERRKKRKRKNKSKDKEKKSHKSKSKKQKKSSKEKSSKEKRGKEKRSKEKRHKSSKHD